MEHTKHHFHISEGARNTTIIVLVVVAVILISYFEWKGRNG